MPNWKSTLALVFLASIGTASTGCVKQSILAFRDHPKYPVTNLELFVTKSYYVYTQREHRFYACTDTEDKLLCKRSCGGSTDVRCPMSVTTSYGGSSNVE